jgi:hypothetical protein
MACFALRIGHPDSATGLRDWCSIAPEAIFSAFLSSFFENLPSKPMARSFDLRHEKAMEGAGRQLIHGIGF